MEVSSSATDLGLHVPFHDFLQLVFSPVLQAGFVYPWSVSKPPSAA